LYGHMSDVYRVYAPLRSWCIFTGCADGTVRQWDLTPLAGMAKALGL